jgi:hypothetical protein
VKYHGGWHDDVPNGRGSHYDEEGNLYEGEWLEGRRGGLGKMAYAGAADCGPGDVYEGQWLNDARHGKGTMTYQNNNVYEGHWEGDERSGRGTLFYVDKGMRFDGVWAADAPRVGVYSDIEAPPAGTPGALPVLELANVQGVLQRAMSV